MLDFRQSMRMSTISKLIKRTKNQLKYYDQIDQNLKTNRIQSNLWLVNQNWSNIDQDWPKIDHNWPRIDLDWT